MSRHVVHHKIKIHPLTDFTVHTEGELDEVATALLNFAGDKKKITLSGGLGAGKTALVKAVCRRLQVKPPPTSPTFALVNEYSYLDESGQERLVHHLDLYRLKNSEEALDIGVEEYLYDEDYCLIEWPEIIEEFLPEDVVQVIIEIMPNASRKILFL